MIPGLKNAEFIRYGVMHRNSFIDSPRVLNKNLSLKNNPNIFFAGQITGVEGYIESVPVFPKYAHCVMLVNEEGKLNNLPINQAATNMYGEYPFDCIAGNALIVKRGEEDLELMSEEEAKKMLERVLRFEKVVKR